MSSSDIILTKQLPTLTAQSKGLESIRQKKILYTLVTQWKKCLADELKNCLVVVILRKDSKNHVCSLFSFDFIHTALVK